MGDLALLIGAIATLVSAGGAAAAAVITAIRSSGKERRRSAENVLERLVEYAKDGQITADELAQLGDEGGDEQ